MLGFTLAIIAAALFTARDGVQKFLTDRTHIYVVYWSAVCFSIPIFFAGVLVQGIPTVTEPFWYVIAVSVPLFIFSSVLLVRAIHISPLSATIPFLGFSPVFMLLTSWIILDQVPSVWGMLGIGIVTIGSYLIHFQGRAAGWLAPVRSLIHERGSWYALIVAGIWSVTANFDKIGIDHSSPMFYLLVSEVASLILFTGYILLRRNISFRAGFTGNVRALVLTGLLTGTATLIQMYAIQLILVPYVITIKRAGSILGGIGIGAIYFKEAGYRHRLLAGCIMLIGVAMILIWR